METTVPSNGDNPFFKRIKPICRRKVKIACNHQKKNRGRNTWFLPRFVREFICLKDV
jgi:hypothetical protein